MTVRARRSVLYMPASNQRALEKAKTLDCDAIIFDLEDAVAPESKVQARQAACDAVVSGQYGSRELIIRVNGVDTDWHEQDLAAACLAQPSAIAVPKVSSAEQVHELVAKFDALGADPRLTLWAMLETPRAIIAADSICAASARLSVVVMGTNDLLNELHAESVPGRQPLQYALCSAVCAARANHKDALDGVFNNIADQSAFEQECLAGRSFGFDGKTLIHPTQIDIANRVWTPRPQELAEARGLITAFEQALEQGAGVATFQGKMIEQLHVANARRLLALSAAIQQR